MSNKEMCKIYKATFPDGKGYVGKTWQKFNRRIGKHLSNSLRGTCPLFRKEYEKQGEPVWEIITNCLTHDVSKYLERFYIEYFGTLEPNGCNILRGGGANKWTDAAKERLRKTREEKGCNKKQSETLKKRWQDPAFRAMMAESYKKRPGYKGYVVKKPHSAERVAKIKAASQDYKRCPQTGRFLPKPQMAAV